MESKEQKDERKSGIVWWWWLLALALLGGLVFFLWKRPVEIAEPSLTPNIQICTEAKTMNAPQCCSDDLGFISIFESSNTFFVTAKFPGLTEKTPTVTGKVYWSTGEAFPTQPIQLVANASPDGCYIGKVQPIHGTSWSLGKYTMKLEVNGKPAGEKLFEIVR